LKLHALAFCILATALLTAPVSATVVGANTPALAITADRISALPPEMQPTWQAYLDRSITQMKADRLTLAAEGPPAQIPSMTMRGDSEKTMPLDQEANWYATPQARHIADVIVSFQTPAGGWSKNQPRDGALRVPGQPYAGDNSSRFSASGDFDTAHDEHWHYVGTLDNDATITELQFLARVITATSGEDATPYRVAFEKGAAYLFNAQFPNGGWPQVWPLEGGYHDAITYNDDAMVHATELMSAIASGADDYAFVPEATRHKAASARDQAIACILATQVIVAGRRTVWGQQHDALTELPVAARNFEPDALSSSESASLLIYLMALPDPSPVIMAAVHDGVTWLHGAALHDVAWTDGGDKTAGRRLIASPGAPDLWARYYVAATAKPIFGDRDKSLHDDVNEISLERRNGYSWFNTAPLKVFKLYAKWSVIHPDSRP
jgi:PelA/Pel-15E family pectate lyase